MTNLFAKYQVKLSEPDDKQQATLSEPVAKQKLKWSDKVVITLGILAILVQIIPYLGSVLIGFFTSLFCFETSDMKAVWTCFALVNLASLVPLFISGSFMGGSFVLYSRRSYWLGLTMAIIPLVIWIVLWGIDTMEVWSVPQSHLFFEYQLMIKPILNWIFHIPTTSP